VSDAFENKGGTNVISLTVGGIPTGTVLVQPHPEDVLDVDPLILARMNARIKGESLNECHDPEDRVSSELLLRLQVKILQKVFERGEKVPSHYTSTKCIGAARATLDSEGFDRDFIELYCSKRWPGEIFDEVDVFAALMLKTEPVLKVTRFKMVEAKLGDGLTATLQKAELKALLHLLKPHYLVQGFMPLYISTEVLQLEPRLRRLLKNGRAVELMNGLLQLFYGGEN
jgi:hypothetical protein